MSLKNYFFLLAILLFLSGCAVKRDPAQKYNLREIHAILRSEGIGQKIYHGKLFIDGEIGLFGESSHSGAFYGYFYVEANRLLIQIRPPFGQENIISWKKNSQELLLVNPSQRKGLRVIFSGIAPFEDLPEYLLGLKEEEVSFRIGPYSGKYRFYRDELKGEITSSLFNITWKLKELYVIEAFPELPPFQNYHFKVLTLTF